MPTALRCLVVENDPAWQDRLRIDLEALAGGAQVVVAAGPDEARALLHGDDRYDLATIDISLLAEPPAGEVDEEGLALVDEFFRDARAAGTALLVVTGHATTERDRRLLRGRNHGVFDIVEKGKYDEKAFLATVCKALFDSRLRQVESRAGRQLRLTLSFGRDRWLGCELRGPQNRGPYRPERPKSFAAARLAERADGINLLVENARGWRQAARRLGIATYKSVQRDSEIADYLHSAKGLATREDPLRIDFAGPASGLAIPFELLCDGGDYLCYEHLMTRRLSQRGLRLARKAEPFHQFLAGLVERGEDLRILLLAPGGGADLPAAQAEVELLGDELKVAGRRFGLGVHVRSLVGPEATSAPVQESLRDGDSHIFHFAGHGGFRDDLPEASGLVLSDGSILRASDLSALVGATPLRLAFLSCCLSARTAGRLGRGDFQGVPDALARAGVPLVLGYRWSVADDGARALAQAFYRSLWRTLSPPQALLDARLSASMGPLGREDETWASPILLSQTD